MSERFNLSVEFPMVYRLKNSGVCGKLTFGSVERIGIHGLNVYDGHGERFEYLSGAAIGSWCIVDLVGKPLSGWCSIIAPDVEMVLAYAQE